MPSVMRGTPVATDPLARIARTSGGARRRRAHRLSLIAAIALLGLACKQDAPSPPDLLLVTLDALPADAIACFGGPAEAGLELCRQAEGGTRFAWAASAARGEASAVATVHSGLPPQLHPVRDIGASFLPDQIETIAERLAGLGYRTGAFVTSPRLNRTRRLDQGFGFYEDRLSPLSDRAAPDALADAVQRWIARAPGPRFGWLHLAGAKDLDALDLTLARVDVAFGDRRHRGVLVVALAGELDAPSLTWVRHRVPLLWRSPTPAPPDGPGVSFRLASLEDVKPTLLAAAGGTPRGNPDASVPGRRGRDLARLAKAPRSTEAEDERRILLGGGRDDAVGLATATHLYARNRTAFDGSGQPIPIETLTVHQARFAPLPLPDPVRHPAPRSGALRPGPWRRDVLASDSPVPSLEFHLARRLAEGEREEAR